MDDGDAVIRPAVAFYTVALERNFTRGRRRELVEASCLYIACRENKKPYLLIDFSDYLQINVYVLGSTFLQLCKVLSLTEHPIVQKPVDPSLFIHRFANRLVGDGYMVVSKTALRIIASMKRDWLQVKIVHICEATLTKRLIEFENTESASLTIEEFEKKAKELDGQNNNTKEVNMASKANGPSELLCEHKGSGKAPFAHGLCESCYQDFVDLSGGLEGGSEPPAFQRAERERMARECATLAANNLCFATTYPCQELESNAQELETVATSGQQKLQSTEPCKDASFTDHVEEVGPDKVSEADGVNFEDKDESDSFSDIDDSEVDGYLHTEEEKKYKKIIWEEMNREYVEEQAAKEAAAAAEKKAMEARYSNCPEELKAALELAAATAAAVAKSRKEKQQKRAAEAKNYVPPQTALEATRQMLTKKRLSSKINYDVLEKLFDDPVNPSKKNRSDENFDADKCPPPSAKDNNSKVSYKDGGLEEDDDFEVGGDGGENPYYEHVEEEYNYDDDYGYEDDVF